MTGDLSRAVLRLVIGYARWTALVPMLTMWGFLLACTFIVSLSSFESQTMAAVELFFILLGAFARLLPESIAPRSADGTVRLSGDDLIDALVLAWLLLSFAAMALGWLIGPRPRPKILKTLPGRLKAAAIAAAILCCSFFVFYAAAPEKFNGTLLSALPLFIGGPLITLAVSAWSLSISAALGLLEAAIERTHSGIRDE